MQHGLGVGQRRVERRTGQGRPPGRSARCPRRRGAAGPGTRGARSGSRRPARRRRRPARRPPASALVASASAALVDQRRQPVARLEQRAPGVCRLRRRLGVPVRPAARRHPGPPAATGGHSPGSACGPRRLRGRHRRRSRPPPAAAAAAARRLPRSGGSPLPAERVAPGGDVPVQLRRRARPMAGDQEARSSKPVATARPAWRRSPRSPPVVTVPLVCGVAGWPWRPAPRSASSSRPAPISGSAAISGSRSART